MAKDKRKREKLGDYLKEHLGKAIENGHATEYILQGAMAIIGYQTYKHPAGLVVGPVALKLALAPSEVAAGSGIAILAHMGLTHAGLLNYLYEGFSWLTKIPEQILKLPEMFGAEVPIIGGPGGTPATPLYKEVFKPEEIGVKK